MQTTSPRNHPDGQTFTTALIVDDHPLFCDALSMTLRTTAGISEITTAETLEGAIAQITQNGRPDVVVLDLNLPDVNGLDGLVRIRNVTDAPIVVVSSMADNRVISGVIHAGANGFVPKHSQRDVFQSAFDTLRRGERFIPAGYVLLDNEPGSDQAETLERLA